MLLLTSASFSIPGASSSNIITSSGSCSVSSSLPIDSSATTPIFGLWFSKKSRVQIYGPCIGKGVMVAVISMWPALFFAVRAV